ncbi:hypothetical protein GGF37_002476 [Kickxella alabastrina]|nr:hypothetical protein GGF37_002476 [Kickxella alabastrina]
MPSHSDSDDMLVSTPEIPIKVTLETEPPVRKPGRPRLDISAHFQDTGEMANHSHRFVWCIECIKSGRPLFKRDRLPARGDLMQRHLQTCKYISKEVRLKFGSSTRSSSVSSNGESKARKARIANIISESGPLNGNPHAAGSNSSSSSLGTTGLRLPPIITVPGGDVERNKLTMAVPRKPAAPMALRPPYSLSRPSAGSENQLPRIRSPQLPQQQYRAQQQHQCSATPIELPPISRRSHPYINRDNHPASLCGPHTPSTPVLSPPLLHTSPDQQHQQQQQRHHHYHHHHLHSSYETSPVSHNQSNPRSSPLSAGGGISICGSEPMVLSQRKGSPTSLPSSATIGARQGESAGEFYSPIPSSAIVTPVTGLRGKLDSGSPAIGIVLSIPSAVTAHIASRLGFDWACIDVESQTHSASIMAEMVAAIGNSETCTSLVRVPAHSSEWIRWAVEAGAQGIIVTGVQNREQMRHLVALCKSTASAGRSQQNQRMSGRHHYQQQQKNMQFGRELLIIPQIDRPEAVDDIDGILSVPGVDAALVHPHALGGGAQGILSAGGSQHRALGVVGWEGAVERVVRSSHRFGVPLGVEGVDSNGEARMRMQQGFQMVAVANDIDILAAGASNQLRLARAI